MKRSQSPCNERKETGWQVLGDLQLTVGSAANGQLDDWLAGTLGKINIQADMIDKVTKSAQEVVARAKQTGDPVWEGWLVRWLVYVPLEVAANHHTWGFFRIEKLAAAGADGSEERQVIEFYLYLEGARTS